MKSYINHVAYQDLTTAVTTAKELLESLKLQTKNTEEALKSAQKEGKSKFELSILDMELSHQKLVERSQKLKQKIAELERNHWVIAFKKSFKKEEKIEKEAPEKAIRKMPKKQLLSKTDEETSESQAMKSKKGKTSKANKSDIANIESPSVNETAIKMGLQKVKK